MLLELVERGTFEWHTFLLVKLHTGSLFYFMTYYTALCMLEILFNIDIPN